jgi:integrase
MSTFNYPKICYTKDQKVFIYFYINQKRYRLYNGKRINSNIDPNSYPFNKRTEMANLLAAEIYNYIIKGGVLKEYRGQKLVTGNLSDKEIISNALKFKLDQNISKCYKKELKYAFDKLIPNMTNSSLKKDDVINTLIHYDNKSSYNSIRKNLNVIFNKALELGLKENPINKIKRCHVKSKLNKPLSDIPRILKELQSFNNKLYICCLMTYGCLLRPHREIRELTWGDFSEDLNYINLSGHRNKSGRNRIVPVPSYIRNILVKGDLNNNIFSGKPKPLNEDYFKTLWSRFKRQSKLLEQGQTLYSFRHSGAIEIFKRTGSLTKLQKAMGHSSLNVSLTYLRGLEVAELTESDMPMV